VLTEHTVARAARAAGIEAPTHFSPVTGSTNEDLVRLADEGAPGWTVVATGHQEQGKGRLGRVWAEAPGSSLLVSVLLRPIVLPSQVALVTLGAGACLAVACSVACGVDVGCKWPNDLVSEDRKLGGVLVEARVEDGRVRHVVIGTGVNLRQHAEDLPADLRDRATSVAILGGRPDDATLLSEYLMRLKRFADPDLPAFRHTVLDLYRRSCVTLDREVRATTTEGEEITGRAVEVGESGELVLETTGGRRAVAFGEVAHLR
jgi:BirA family biotin operon repressor/biotin-[acetyl-CoA-carboxylase] ligase